MENKRLLEVRSMLLNPGDRLRLGYRILYFISAREFSRTFYS